MLCFGSNRFVPASCAECRNDEKALVCSCVEAEASSDCAVLLTPSGPPLLIAQPLTKQPFIHFVYQALNCSENDYAALFSLCLLFALGHNKGILFSNQFSCGLIKLRKMK